MVADIFKKYDDCDIVLGKIRHLNSEEKGQMHLWFGKQLDAILLMQPHAVNSRDLEYEILEKRVFAGCWENMNAAKKFATELLGYVRRYEQLPPVVYNVIEPDYPPVYRIAKMKSKGYSDEEIKEKAKAWGIEETKVAEIIENRANIIANFDLGSFCRELEKTRKKS